MDSILGRLTITEHPERIGDETIRDGSMEIRERSLRALPDPINQHIEIGRSCHHFRTVIRVQNQWLVVPTAAFAVVLRHRGVPIHIHHGVLDHLLIPDSVMNTIADMIVNVRLIHLVDTSFVA